MINPDTIRCDDLDRLLDAYLAGTLPESEAVALETHAASCARCEARLDAATRRPVDLSAALPATLREDTLRAVAVARGASPRRAARTMRVPWAWAGGITSIAAAALVYVVTQRVEPTRPDVIDSTRRPVVATAPDTEVPSRERVAARLADQEAQSEFAALDAAGKELEAALAAAPADRELRAYLSSVRARRDELARRVKAAAS
jgi:hypothetical protein